MASVVWWTKVWNCWIDVFHFESTSSCTWSSFLDDIEILDKVLSLLILVSCIGNSFLLMIFMVLGVAVWFLLFMSVFTRSSVFVKVSLRPFLIWLKDYFLRTRTLQQHLKSHFLKRPHLMRWHFLVPLVNILLYVVCWMQPLGWIMSSVFIWEKLACPKHIFLNVILITKHVLR